MWCAPQVPVVMLDSMSTVLPFSRSPALPFSRSPVLPFSRSPVLPFSRSPVLLKFLKSLGDFRNLNIIIGNFCFKMR